RRAAADVELGQHDRGGTREPRSGAAACFPAGSGDVSHRAFLQSRRRRPARADRSAAGRAVTDKILLSVEDIQVDLPTPRGNLRAVDRVNLTVGAGQTLGVVGESGCGKT